jgi:hypothetical protein
VAAAARLAAAVASQFRHNHQHHDNQHQQLLLAVCWRLLLCAALQPFHAVGSPAEGSGSACRKPAATLVEQFMTFDI